VRVSTPILLAVLVALVTGSAVESAEPAKKQTPPEAVNIFNDGVNFQNNGAFGLAIDEYQRFLERFPGDPLELRTRLYLGGCLVQVKKLEEALEQFEAVLAGDKKFRNREDAYLQLGMCQYRLAKQGQAGMHEKAAKTFGDLAAELPKGKYADEAWYMRGESLYAVDKKPEAIAAYAKVVEGYAESKRRADALYALGATQEEVGSFADAGVTYDTFLKEFPDHELATEVQMRKAETLSRTGELAEAEALFAKAAAVPNFALADHATFCQAECALKQNKHAAAGALFAAVVTKYPQSAYAQAATMRAGISYYLASDLDNAAPWLDKVIKGAGKGAVEAAHWRCRIHLAKGEPADAAKLAAQTLTKAGESPFVPELIMDQADALFEIPERRAESLPLYGKVAEEHADHSQAPQALYNIAFAELDLKKYNQGLAHANTFIEKYSDHELLRATKYVAAECLLELGRHAESEKVYRELVAAGSGHPDLENWRLRLGVVLFLQKKWQDVVDTLTPLVGSFKNADRIAHAQHLIGTSQYFLGAFDEAVTALEASLAANPKWTQSDEALFNLSRAQRKKDLLKPAIASVKRMIQEFPQSKLLDRAHFSLAEYSYASEDYPTAAAEYDTVLTTWPDSPLVPNAHYSKAWAQVKTKKYAEAAASFTALIDGHPDHKLVPEAHKNRAICRYHAADYAGAITDCDTFLASEPAADERVDALYVRGMCQSRAKKYPAAIETFKTILSEKPDYANAAGALYELAWACKYGKQDDDATKYFEQLASEHPDSRHSGEALFHVGDAKYKAKQHAEAVDRYTKALEKAGTDDLKEKANYMLGYSNHHLKKYEDALSAFTTQVDSFPNGTLFGDGLFMQAECLFQLDRFEEALPIYLKCQQRGGYSDDKQVLTLLHAGQSASQTDDWNQALELLEQITESHPDSDSVPEALYEQGWAKQNLGQTEDAKKLYLSVAEKRPRDELGARARFMLGELYFGEKDYAKASAEFQRVLFGFGGKQAADDVKNWQAKSGYELGRCNEVRIKGAKKPAEKQQFIADAKRYYSTVVKDFPDSNVAKLAAQRMTVLNNL
jgi:TolA-binding protein